MTLFQLLDSWRQAPGFIALRHLSRQELQKDPPIYLDKYLRFDGRTPPDTIYGKNADVLVVNHGLPNEEALVVSWR